MEIETIKQLIETYKYWVLFPLAIIEGPMLALLSGVFIKLDFLKFVPAFCIMMLGDIIPDSFFYYLGNTSHDRKLTKKFTSKLNDESLIIKLWKLHPIKTLITAKLAFGIAPALLVTAGVARYPYKKFVILSLIVTIIQYGTFMGLGYWLGYSYEIVQDAKYFGMIIAACFVVFAFIFVRIQKKAKREIEEMEREELIKTDTNPS